MRKTLSFLELWIIIFFFKLCFFLSTSYLAARNTCVTELTFHNSGEEKKGGMNRTCCLIRHSLSHYFTYIEGWIWSIFFSWLEQIHNWETDLSLLAVCVELLVQSRQSIEM